MRIRSSLRAFPAVAAWSLLLAAHAALVHAQITPEQITQLQAVGTVALSPDGRWVAYTLSQPRAPEEDTVAGLRPYSELWLAPDDDMRDRYPELLEWVHITEYMASSR